MADGCPHPSAEPERAQLFGLFARPVHRGGRLRLLRQQSVAVDDCGRHVDELSVRRARVLTQHLEGRRLIDRVAFHEDALRTFGDGAATEGAFEIVVLGETAQDDVDRAQWDALQRPIRPATFMALCHRPSGRRRGMLLPRRLPCQD
jgi:hypothetical protein